MKVSITGVKCYEFVQKYIDYDKIQGIDTRNWKLMSDFLIDMEHFDSATGETTMFEFVARVMQGHSLLLAYFK